MAKLEIRDPELRGRLAFVSCPLSHPSFRIVSGDVETWEKRPGPLPNNALQRTHSRVTSRAEKAHGPRHAARR